LTPSATAGGVAEQAGQPLDGDLGDAGGVPTQVMALARPYDDLDGPRRLRYAEGVGVPVDDQGR
jgi:hypothetical protein